MHTFFAVLALTFATLPPAVAAAIWVGGPLVYYGSTIFGEPEHNGAPQHTAAAAVWLYACSGMQHSGGISLHLVWAAACNDSSCQGLVAELKTSCTVLPERLRTLLSMHPFWKWWTPLDQVPQIEEPSAILMALRMSPRVILYCTQAAASGRPSAPGSRAT